MAMVRRGGPHGQKHVQRDETVTASMAQDGGSSVSTSPWRSSSPASSSRPTLATARVGLLRRRTTVFVWLVISLFFAVRFLSPNNPTTSTALRAVQSTYGETNLTHPTTLDSSSILRPDTILWSKNWYRVVVNDTQRFKETQRECPPLSTSTSNVHRIPEVFSFEGPPKEYYWRHTESKATKEELQAWFGVQLKTNPHDDTHNYLCSTLSERRIWIRSHDIDAFAQHVLAHWSEPIHDDGRSSQLRIVLITSDGDRSVPSSLQSSTATTILKSPHVVAWYAQNYDGTITHPKLFPLPIGFDLHTHWNGLQFPNIANFKQDTHQSPQQQDIAKQTVLDADLTLNLQQTLLPLRQRGAQHRSSVSQTTPSIPSVFIPPMALAPWSHWHRRKAVTTLTSCLQYWQRSGNRPPLYDMIQSPYSLYALLGTGPKLPITTLWGEYYTRYEFVLSPPGVGIDCHRTWEILFFGGIPIVESSSLDSLFDDLPVVIVKDTSYAEFCQSDPAAFLQEAYGQLQSKLPMPDKVFTMEYWLQRHHYA